MTRSRVTPSPATRSTHLALVLLVVAVAMIAVLELVLGLDGATEPWHPVLFQLVAAVYLGAGVLAWWWRPSNRLGLIMVVGCGALLLGALGFTTVPVLIAVSTVGATMILAVMVHLLHAFPSGRLRGRLSRWTVLGGYAVSLVLQAPQYLFAPAPPPYHLLGVADRPALVTTGLFVQAAAGAVVMVVTTVLLVRRLRAADPPRRRVLAPLYSYGVVAVLFIPVSANVIRPLLDVPPETIGTAQLAVIGGVPLAFCLGLLRGGFARTGEVEELGAWLGGTGTARTTLVEALSRTLGDPTLQLVFWVPDTREYVDASGQPVDLPSVDGDRDVVTVDLDGRRVGAIVYDATLLGDPEPVRAAGRVIALAVDRERLTAQLRAGEQALRLSRERLVEAGDLERRRIAQNLHDGVQAELVVLGLDAQRIAADPAATPATVQAATALRAGIDVTAGELRRFVYGVMPAPLLERGLAAAAEDLVDHLPLRTRLEVSVDGQHLSSAVESTAYFVLAEGLTNAVRHAQARELAVRLAASDGTLLVEVGDDGVGGAHLNSGLGLRSLADRVDVLGGRLRLDSPAGGGTRLTAELPCAS
ncbi:histidine kinase [Ornithinimicrobium sp. F0845]|uniref:sensor histidine kinase n=1 Tax=Ornithinimicrobium sp. F0845 TaxID=2926412 RepID=UPI001FF3A73A|nr:ATP-binding protein [Ornithinimicrobium sp. F0845]MCK0112209.1 histidine kinase [Ornithinimicrobium sp. F0845]